MTREKPRKDRRKTWSRSKLSCHCFILSYFLVGWFAIVLFYAIFGGLVGDCFIPSYFLVGGWVGGLVGECFIPSYVFGGLV